jgi:hypothetical protein
LNPVRHCIEFGDRLLPGENKHHFHHHHHHQALDKGIVFNAKDACVQLGLDADGLNTEWGNITQHHAASHSITQHHTAPHTL